MLQMLSYVSGHDDIDSCWSFIYQNDNAIL